MNLEKKVAVLSKQQPMCPENHFEQYFLKTIKKLTFFDIRAKEIPLLQNTRSAVTNFALHLSTRPVLRKKLVFGLYCNRTISYWKLPKKSRTFQQKYLPRLSKLHSTCPLEKFKEKKFRSIFCNFIKVLSQLSSTCPEKKMSERVFLKKNIFLKCFHSVGQTVSGFLKKFFSSTFSELRSTCLEEHFEETWSPSGIITSLHFFWKWAKLISIFDKKFKASLSQLHRIILTERRLFWVKFHVKTNFSYGKDISGVSEKKYLAGWSKLQFTRRQEFFQKIGSFGKKGSRFFRTWAKPFWTIDTSFRTWFSKLHCTWQDRVCGKTFLFSNQLVWCNSFRKLGETLLVFGKIFSIGSNKTAFYVSNKLFWQKILLEIIFSFGAKVLRISAQTS